MKKRKISLPLALALCLTLCACGPGTEEPSPSPALTTPPPEASVPVLETPAPMPTPTPRPTPSPAPSAPPLAGYDLPGRDYRPWQVGYMEFLARLRRIESESQWEQEAFQGLAADGRGSLGIWSVDQDMTYLMRTGSESYSLHDVDRDGVPELIVDYLGREAQCYTWRDGQVTCVGEFHSKDSSLYSHPDKNAILRAGGRMGYYQLYEYPMEGGVLTEEREIFSEGRVDFPTGAEEIVPGARLIDRFWTQLGEWDDRKYYEPDSEWREFDDGRPHPSAGKALLLPIADWCGGPAATGSDSEQARAAILAALNGETELYGASGDHFYGDVGWTAWAEYIQPGAAYPWNEESLEIKTHVWLDMNGDGQEECVLQVSEPERADDAVTRSRYTVVLSHQDGTVYAYFFGIYDLELCADGAFQLDYGGPVRLSFWRDQCYDYAVPEASAPAVKWADGSPLD